MTSLQIAEITGKNHKDIMRAIRTMEPAWEKVNGRNFALVEYKDQKGELRPCYELSKTECLYIAKKFNKVLAENRIQHKINGQWILYSPYNSEGYVQSKSLNITRNNGTVMIKMLTEWTQRGRIFLYQTLKSKGILPLIEQSA